METKEKTIGNMTMKELRKVIKGEVDKILTKAVNSALNLRS